MPELPEVETIRQDLSKAILGEKIKEIKIKSSKSIKNDIDFFKKELRFAKIEKVDRVGKLLIFHLSDKDLFLLVHLKMTGQLILDTGREKIKGGHEEPAGAEEKYCRAIFVFEDGKKLFFNDLRKFGYLKLVRSEELEAVKTSFGIEPLTNNFKLSEFEKIFKNRKTNVKSLLLNQKLIAGIGNIYADETLFEAKIDPRKLGGKLSKAEIEKLFRSIKKIIKKAVKSRGTTFKDYKDASGKKGNFSDYLQVYGRAGQKCFNCSGEVKKIKLAGRGTHFCPRCQK